MTFDEAFDRLLGHEGDFVDHKDDPGHATRWGVTERVARANGYTGSMRELPQSFARQVYRKSYWDRVRADELPPALAFQVFDAAVNHGAAQAVKLLQRAVGVADDGLIGPVTLLAANTADVPAAVMRFNALRLRLYASLPTWGSFGRGWVRRVAENLRLAAGAPT